MRKRINVALVGFIILTIILILIDIFTPFNFFSRIAQSVFKNPKLSLYQLKTSKNDPGDIKNLKDENQKLISKLVDFETMKKDNDALRNQFQDSPIPPQQLLPAHVIGFMGKSNTPQKLIIDKGKDEGVKTGSNVILGKNFVGLVTTVSSHFSHVSLSTNTSFTTLGKTLQDNALGVIHGQDDFILLDTVVITDKLTQGDIVLTRGELKNKENKVINDLIVGKIYSINKNETKPFQTAQVRPSIDYSRINLVFIAANE